MYLRAQLKLTSLQLRGVPSDGLHCAESSVSRELDPVEGRGKLVRFAVYFLLKRGQLFYIFIYRK